MRVHIPIPEAPRPTEIYSEIKLLRRRIGQLRALLPLAEQQHTPTGDDDVLLRRAKHVEVPTDAA